MSTPDSLNIHPVEAGIAATPGKSSEKLPARMLMKKQDARFDVAGGPSSLLSVSLSASQDLYARKGTLVGIAGKAENVSSITIAPQACMLTNCLDYLNLVPFRAFQPVLSAHTFLIPEDKLYNTHHSTYLSESLQHINSCCSS